MSMSGETVLSVYEQDAFAAIAESYGGSIQAPEEDVAAGGLTLVMQRAQDVAAQQMERMAEGLPLITEDTAFQSAA
jgi:hypothetical protein